MVREPDELADGIAVVSGAQRITVLSGAGISTDSGIPDFRGPNGLWTRDPKAERLSSFQAYRDDPEVRRTSWQARLTHPVWQARPNDAHRALVKLERAGRLVSLVTQNIDGLHQSAGSTSVLELHGTMHETVCLQCNERRPMSEALERVADGNPDPTCRVCGGILKSATISFGQPLEMTVLEAARDAVLASDLMLAVGSSLSVQPAAGLVGLAARAGATVMICNASETPYDEMAAIVLRESLGDVLPALVG
ncbi:SIR2 family NAD-dependent protein deacylase [Actinophytocola glycyrrhizae]|uniref:protein acetyllysine N-acetyltransferase n=1 Tax=Actinophytocola glycyrrhizae TaxID=2044873 RepID=A0ABV9S5Q4_9PSEU